MGIQVPIDVPQGEELDERDDDNAVLQRILRGRRREIAQDEGEGSNDADEVDVAHVPGKASAVGRNGPLLERDGKHESDSGYEVKRRDEEEQRPEPADCAQLRESLG